MEGECSGLDWRLLWRVGSQACSTGLVAKRVDCYKAHPTLRPYLCPTCLFPFHFLLCVEAAWADCSPDLWLASLPHHVEKKCLFTIVLVYLVTAFENGPRRIAASLSLCSLLLIYSISSYRLSWQLPAMWGLKKSNICNCQVVMLEAWLPHLFPSLLHPGRSFVGGPGTSS